jgi:sphingomyelin phosphodiesterase 2
MSRRGLKFVSKNRDERIKGIADFVARSNHDIIALQELWVFADYEKVRAAVQHRLSHAKFFYRCVTDLPECQYSYSPRRISGALGAGLAIFSRFPFIEASVHPYSLNGEPTDVAGGDWFVGKAAASVLILHPVLGKVQVVNTHVCCPYWLSEWLTHPRSSSTPKAARMAQSTREPTDLWAPGSMPNLPGKQPS